MMNVRGAAESSPPGSIDTAEKAISFISKGWREVKDGAESDIQLMKARANSFKTNLTSSLEKDNFFFTRKTPPSTVRDLDFVKKLHPKLTEFRRTYSSPEYFSRKVIQKWNSTASKFDFTLLIKNSLLLSDLEEEEGGGGGQIVEFDSERKKKKKQAHNKRWNSSVWIKGGDNEQEEEEEAQKEWEPIKILKTRLKKEFEPKKTPPTTFRRIDFLDKLKKKLESDNGEIQDSKEVAPLDATELLAYLLKQSGSFLDQLGLKKDICNKIVDALYNRRRELGMRALSRGDTSISSIQDNEYSSDELDLRIASVLQSTGYCYEGGLWTDFVKKDLRPKKRNVAIITTASLPWMTGTAINPLFRAAYLSRSGKQKVTLLVPWLSISDQELVYPNKLTFDTPQQQEEYIRDWLEARVGFKSDFQISFYPGKFHKERRSIIPAGDTSQFIPSKEADIAILEEPEHLNWYHHGQRWTDKFNYVVGIVHTNYLEYIKREKNGPLQAFFVKHINNLVTRAYCDKVLRLSAATQDLPKSVVCNVHGVNPKFLKVGEKIAADRERGEQPFSKGAYFLGKMVWAKGYRELIDLLSKHRHDLGGFNLDVFGNGEDSHEVKSAAKKLKLNMNFLMGRDHADDSLHGYKIFINPSISDVLCTATAEALAMGKFVICADHPSNEFFRSFPNCLTYKTSEDFLEKLKEAIEKDPQPLTTEQKYNLSWEAATQRFIEYAELEKLLNNNLVEAPMRKQGQLKMNKSLSFPSLREIVDGGLAFAHYCLTGNELLRLSTGAMPGTREYDKQHCMDLHLLPSEVENPVYGW